MRPKSLAPCGLMTDPSAGLNLRPLSFSTVVRLAAELDLDSPLFFLSPSAAGTLRNESCGGAFASVNMVRELPNMMS